MQCYVELVVYAFMKRLAPVVRCGRDYLWDMVSLGTISVTLTVGGVLYVVCAARLCVHDRWGD